MKNIVVNIYYLIFFLIQAIERQIIAEYIATKNDPNHVKSKKRFNYLHDKLSHIKRLVLEYDTQYLLTNTVKGTSGTTNDSEDIMENGDSRY